MSDRARLVTGLVAYLVLRREGTDRLVQQLEVIVGDVDDRQLPFALHRAEGVHVAPTEAQAETFSHGSGSPSFRGRRRPCS
jgi:hypothetical protein